MLLSSALFGDIGLYWISAVLQVTMTEILPDIPQALRNVITSIFPYKPIRVTVNLMTYLVFAITSTYLCYKIDLQTMKLKQHG
jgi:hypothetical protein